MNCYIQSMEKCVSSSPERYTFQMKQYLDRLENDPNDELANGCLEVFNSMKKADMERINDPAWQQDNLEYDLRSTDWILQKARTSRVYSQHLYAALCNNDFTKNEVWPILQGKIWGCSWRHAGGIIADMREEGDYIDWYCSGIQYTYSDADDEVFQKMSKDEQERFLETSRFVAESTVTDEIRADLLKLGWVVVTDDQEKE